MNKIYKVIWSKVKHQYVVTSEFAHSCTKSTTSRVGKSALAALAAFVLTAGVGGVQAAGENAVSEGPGSSAAADNSVAIGKNARVDEWSPAAIAIGKDSFVHGPYSVAIGEGSSTSRENAVALGRNSHANGAGSVALGYHTDAQAEDSVALGDFSKATKANTVSVGNATLKRQIVNVAAGTDADDVVTVGQLQDPSDKATKTIHGVTLDNGTIEAANGNFAVGEDGTTHIRAGQSQIQVRDDLTGLNYGSNSVIVNRDGVTLTGDVAADNSIKVGLVGYDEDNGFAPIYGTEIGEDGNFSTAQGSFRVDKDGNVWAANGNVTIDADGTTYIHAGQSELQVTDNQAVLRHGNNGVIVNNDGVSVAGDLAADNGLKVGVDGNGIYNFEVGEDGSLRAAQGNFTVDADGTTYAHAGQSELQVTDNQAVLRHGNNGVIVNNDGVSVAGDLAADNGLKVGVAAYDSDGNGIYNFEVGEDGSLRAAQGNFTVDADGTTYVHAGQSELQVTDTQAVLRHGTNGVIVNNDGVSIAGDLKLDGALDTGDLDADSLYVADGKFTVDSDGTMYSQVGKSQLQVRGDYVGMNYGPNTSIGLNEDGVTLTGDVAADNSIKVGLVGYDADNDFAPIYGTEMGADGSFSTAQGSFRVDKDGNVWAANGDVTIDADGTTYVHAGRSELQVTEDQSVLRHADNGIIVNEDGVAVAGDFEAGNGAVKINKDGELWAGNGNFRVTGDGDVYSQNGKSQFQVTDNLVAMQYGTNNYVMVNEDGVSISGDLKLDGALDTGDLDADSLYVAGGKFTVDSDGTMYSQVGKSQLQVRGDYVGMNYGPNTSIGLNEDGVTVRGDVSVEDDLRIGDKIYFGNDGSLAMGNGAFSVDPDGQLSVGYGKATINKYGVITASNMYIGDSANENNRVVTKGELGQAVDGAVTEATEGAVKWDKDDSGNYTNSINGVGLEDGNVTADTVTTTGDVNVGGDLNVDGSLTVGGETVATGADVSGIKGQIGVNEDGGYKTINNGASDVITGINNNTTAINEVKTTVGSGKLDNGAADLTSGINQNTAAIAQNSQAINSLGHRVSDLGDEIDSVGAISAALAGLHPLDYDGTGSKFQISAAMGTYDGTQAAAIGGFYHFNRDVMLSLGGATSFEGDKKTAANIGVTFRVGEGASGKSVSDDVMARLEAMDQKIAALEQENKDLKNVLGAIDTSLSKEFPDVPANHWAYEAVTKLAGNDVVAGYPDGEFHGDRTMTRYEMAEIIYKAMSKGVQVDQKLVNEFKPEMEQVAANQNA